MDIKKEAKFRVIVKDIKSGKTRVITIYQNHKIMELQEFVEGLKKKLMEW